MKSRNIEKIVAIGFFPVNIEFTDEAWVTADKYEGIRTCVSSPLWLRHVPQIGDEILISSDASSIRGTVIKRAFAFLDDAFPNLGSTMLYLLVDHLIPCDLKNTGNLWETSSEMQKTTAPSTSIISHPLKIRPIPNLCILRIN